MVLGCCLPEWMYRTVPARWPISRLLPGRVRRGADHAQAVDQPILGPLYVDWGLQDSMFRESVHAGEWTGQPSDYGSEGWGFESLRARKIKRCLTCGNAGQMSFKIRPLWTPGAPGVLVRSGIVCAGVAGGVLLRVDPSGSWVGPRGGRRG